MINEIFKALFACDCCGGCGGCGNPYNYHIETGYKVNKFRHIKSIYLTGRVNKYIII